jgi:L-seryl-tRNA(Ser) seleniumtransferase
MGALAAVEAWFKKDLAALDKEWDSRVRRIAKLVDTVPGVKTEIQIPKGGNRYPTLVVTWDEQAWNFTVADCDSKLRDGEPRIEVLTASNPSMVPFARPGGDNKTPRRRDQIRIISMTMQPGEDLVVGKRLRDILNEARKRAA